MLKSPAYFKTITKQKIKLPVFFPDATQAVIKTLDSIDIKNTFTPGVLVNTYHLYYQLGTQVIQSHHGIKNFMSWSGGIISDSGGFQIMSLVKAKSQGKITDQGVTFYPTRKKSLLFTPETSIEFQMLLATDMVVVLDDFTPPHATYQQAKESVERTIHWAKRSKHKFQNLLKLKRFSSTPPPYILAVIQGGDYLDLREHCAEQLIKIGFDGLGYGGWPLTTKGQFNHQIAKLIADITPKNYFLYGLGIGKPENIVDCVDLGYHIFDCVLPTRDARHSRLYVYQADSLHHINIRKPKFYNFFTPSKTRHLKDYRPISSACDCLLCAQYTRSYLAHLFQIQEPTALRLSTIHNLRFYSLLMEQLQKETPRR